MMKLTSAINIVKPNFGNKIDQESYTTLQKSWDVEKGKIRLLKWIRQRDATIVNKKSKTVKINDRVFKYDPAKPLSKVLSNAMFKETFVVATKGMTKAQKRTYETGELEVRKTREMYQKITSLEKIKGAYKKYMDRTTDVAWRGSALKDRVGQLMITNIERAGLKGLEYVFRFKEAMMEHMKKLTGAPGVKIQLDAVFVVEEETFDKEKVQKDFNTRTRQYEVIDPESVKTVLAQMVEEIKLEFENKELHKSGLKVVKISKLTLHYARWNPTRAGSYIEAPDFIQKQALVNVKNEDKYCFKYAVLCAVHEVYDKTSRPNVPSRYAKYDELGQVSWAGLTFPVSNQDLDIFEENN